MNVNIREKEILIRADGNAKIGAGHLMRCLTIAEAVGEKTQIGFVCADEDSASLAASRGFDVYVMNTDYRHMEQELPVWEQMLGTTENTHGEGICQKVILVDSYYVTNPYLEELASYGKVVLLDYMGGQTWNVEKLINYNVYADDAMYEALQSPFKTTYYVGGQYIPLRQEFCGRNYEVRQCAKHILITTGGGDNENIAGQILEKIRDEEYVYHVVTGRFNPHYDTLLMQAKEFGNVKLYHDVKDMAALMEMCDLAVTAGGTTVYELSAIGVPFVCFSYAENQEKLVEYIGNEEIAGSGGAYHRNAVKTLESIRIQMQELCHNVILRRRYMKAEQKLVDGEGTFRIAEILKQTAMSG